LAKKNSVEKPPRQFTKRQISHIKRQKRRQNIILYSGIAVIAAIVIILVVGVYLSQVRPYRQTVIKVYDREFNTQYCIDTTEYVGKLASVNYPFTSADYPQLFQEVPYLIELSELMRRGAAEVGITVSDDEVKEYLKEQEGILGIEITANEATIDLARTDLLIEKVKEEHIMPDIPATGDQVHMMVMLLESENQAHDILLKLEGGEEFTTLAEEYSLDSYSQETQGDLGWHIQEYLEYQLGTTVPVEYAFGAEAGTLSQPLYDENLEKGIGYWIVNILERQDEQANLQVILVGSQWEAGIVIQRIINGNDFGELAREFSQDKASKEQGGNLGMVTQGVRTTAFDDYIFYPDAKDMGILGPFSDEGVTTQGGYWLVKVVDREDNRSLEEEDKEYLASNAFSNWYSGLWADAAAEIDESNLTSEVQQWMLDKLMEK
jgi:parvulin-like peptidyl-prolyl isomerase